MDPQIFADPDPGSQNLADPTDPNHSTDFLKACLYCMDPQVTINKQVKNNDV